MKDIEKWVFGSIAGSMALDLIFNDGKNTKELLELILERRQKIQVVYVPVTEKDLEDCAFGC